MRPWVLLAPLPAVAVGFAVAAAHGVSWMSYVPNLLGMLLGSALVYGASFVARDKLVTWIPGIVVLLIFATLFGAGIDGVHRWLSVGPIRLNASAALTPWLLIGFNDCRASSPWRAVVAVLLAQVIHLMQPDAGQATALVAVLLPLLLCPSRIKSPIGLPFAAAVVFLAAVTWLRHDPLPAIDHVERILILASTRGPLVMLALALALLVLLLPFVIATRESRPSAIDVALISYVVASFLVTFVGNFPVPIIGAGAGPVLGWYALLAVHHDSHRPPGVRGRSTRGCSTVPSSPAARP